MTPRSGMGALSAGALRMRRSRERRRQGDVIVSLEVAPNVTAGLVALGWLPGPDHGEKNAIASALSGLVDRAIQARVSPQVGLHDELGFMCTLKRSTIEALITFGWLPVDQQDDLGSIARAFRRFAGRALDFARNGKGPDDPWYFP